MKISVLSSGFLLLLLITAGGQGYIQRSKDFYFGVREGNKIKTDQAIDLLAKASGDLLKKELNSEEKAKAFWLNLYNAFIQYHLNKNPKLFDDRGNFFKSELMTVAGQKLSFDDIEHGIIRHSRNKYSMGYVGKISIPEFEKKFRLEKIDYRIHFALNCGARSCPPVAFYEASTLEEQLNKSTKLYLKSVSRYDAKDNTVYAPMLCSWFKADFDGEDGVRKMMIENKIIPAGKSPAVKYLDYDWTLKLSNYIEL